MEETPSDVDGIPSVVPRPVVTPDTTDGQLMDTVEAHLLRQGRRSSNSPDGSGRCLYRGAEGTSCAVGCLITDAAYGLHSWKGESYAGTPLHDSGNYLEGKDVFHERLQEALRESGVAVDRANTLGLLRELQSIHDGVDPEEWAKELAILRHARQLPERAVAL